MTAKACKRAIARKGVLEKAMADAGRLLGGWVTFGTHLNVHGNKI